MERLSEMRSRFDEGFSSSDRLFLQDMSVLLLGHPVRNTSCKDCYRDAYLEIRYKLKKLGIMPKEKKFYLRAGVLLHFAGEMYVNENLTDDIALDALNDNIKRLDLFQTKPENLDELLAARKAVKAEAQGVVDDTSKEELLKQIDGLKAVNAEQAEKLEDAEKAIKDKEETIKALEQKVSDTGTALENELKETREALEKSKAEAQAEIDRLNGDITEKDAKIAELESALTAAKEAAEDAAKNSTVAAPAAPAEESADVTEAPKGKTTAKK